MKNRILKTPDDAIKRLIKIKKELSKDAEVLIGLPKGSNPYPDGESVIEIGTIHEFGSPQNNIPERSFLRSTISEKKKQYQSMLKKLGLKIIAGKMTIEKALAIAGLQAQGDVKKKVIDIKSPSLKTRKGGNPLVDTGHLLESITFEIKE